MVDALALVEQSRLYCIVKISQIIADGYFMEQNVQYIKSWVKAEEIHYYEMNLDLFWKSHATLMQYTCNIGQGLQCFSSVHVKEPKCD